MEVKSFIDLDDALDWIALCFVYQKDEYFKVEIYQTDDGRFRVGIITERQLELDI